MIVTKYVTQAPYENFVYFRIWEVQTPNRIAILSAFVLSRPESP
jgi:hypothetical protein